MEENRIVISKTKFRELTISVEDVAIFEAWKRIAQAAQERVGEECASDVETVQDFLILSLLKRVKGQNIEEANEE